jgi:hypothetical protein
MKNALETGHLTDAAGLLQQLEDYACKLRDDAEGVEVLLECSDAAERFGNLDQAGSILVEAVSRAWSDLHRRATLKHYLWKKTP